MPSLVKMQVKLMSQLDSPCARSGTVACFKGYTAEALHREQDVDLETMLFGSAQAPYLSVIYIRQVTHR